MGRNYARLTFEEVAYEKGLRAGRAECNDLLAVCKEALEQIIKAEDYESDCMPDYSIVERLTAVIAKAEGKP
jgi:hypothetical protein